MNYCSKCGKEIKEGNEYCENCSAPVNPPAATENLSAGAAPASGYNGNAAQTPFGVAPAGSDPFVYTGVDGSADSGKAKKKKTKKALIISAVAVLVIALAVTAGLVVMHINSTNAYEDDLKAAYEAMVDGAEDAEAYCSLKSKVWRNSIYQNDSYETDKYTKDSYGEFYSDFNRAISRFYIGEEDNYSIISKNIDRVNDYMAELKDCPSKYKDEYKALKAMYVAYSELTDLVVGNSSYSLTTFDDAFASARTNFKTAKSDASLVID